MGDRNGVSRILDILRNHGAPGPADAVYQEVKRILQYRCAGQTMVEFIVEFDLPRRRAESKMAAGTWFPDEFASILRMLNAVLPRKGKSLVMASGHASLKFAEVAASMRRLFGLLGGGSLQDELIAEDADGPSVRDKDQVAGATYTKAKNHGLGRKGRTVPPKLAAVKCEGAGRLWMVLTAVQARVIGAVGVVASTTWRPKAHGGIPGEGIGARQPGSAVRLGNQPVLQFPRRPRFGPRRRGMWSVRGPRVNANKHFRPHWMWGIALGFG